MSYIDDLGDELAQRCLRIMAATGDEDLPNTLSKLLGASSQSAQEAFMTAFRVRRAVAKAHELLDAREPAPPAGGARG